MIISDRVIAEIVIVRKHCQGKIEYRIISPNGEVRWISDRIRILS
ncbi:MAG: hypothetical protein RMY28_012135 [Nostoc sp. ChiSLP01]|nr:hypothetical protein [Nostoc sp. CmiSLP01]MDZ8289221.1 hypothetical protein [Nostoc sp. ChiSLP01]